MRNVLQQGAQWTADFFWKQIQWVAAQGQAQKARLESQKLELQRAYTAARNANDAEKMAALEPLIHQNSALRMRWNELRSQFNSLIETARYQLAQHGITEPPTLAGLGQLETLVVPASWVVSGLVIFGIIAAIDFGINQVNDGMKKLGPIGSTALSLVPLAVAGLALVYFLPRLRRAVAA